MEFVLTEDARSELFACEQHRTLSLLYIHQDHVAVLPPGAKCMGKYLARFCHTFYSMCIVQVNFHSLV